jgi:hypothetical protein
MPSPAAESRHATHVEDLLHQRGASHLRARKYGSAVLVESGPASDPVKHFRLRRESSVLWRLDMATHTGRWEPTPSRSDRRPGNDRRGRLPVDAYAHRVEPGANFRSRVLARAEKRTPRKLVELDYLLGVYDGHRMGGLRFRIGTGPFLDDNASSSPCSRGF